MTDFGPDWPIWELKVPREKLVDRLVDPLGGIALIDLDVDPQPVLAVLSERAEQAVQTRGINGPYFWYYNEDAAGQPFEPQQMASLFSTPEEEQALLHPLNQAVREARNGVVEAFGAEPGPQRLALFGQKRVLLTPNHWDEDVIVNAWLGATRSGLRILHNGTWLPVDNVPAGHALLWRGKVPNHTDHLEPLRHRAVFRSVHYRYALLSWGREGSAYPYVS